MVQLDGGGKLDSNLHFFKQENDLCVYQFYNLFCFNQNQSHKVTVNSSLTLEVKEKVPKSKVTPFCWKNSSEVILLHVFSTSDSCRKM